MINASHEIFAADSIPARRDWTLDATGNQTAVDYFNSYGSNSFAWQNWHQNTANTVNEYTTRKSQTGPKGSLWDLFSSNSPLNWTCPGSGDTFSINTTAKTLTVGTVSRDTIDGYLEPQAQALILTGQNLGPSLPNVTVTIPTGVTSGQFGFVFGYKNGGDYWLWAQDMAGTANVYHVSAGVSTLKATVSYPAPTPGVPCTFGVFGGWRWINQGGASIDAAQSKLSLPTGADRGMVKKQDDLLPGDLISQQRGRLIGFPDDIMRLIRISDGVRRGSGEGNDGWRDGDPP